MTSFQKLIYQMNIQICNKLDVLYLFLNAHTHIRALLSQPHCRSNMHPKHIAYHK